jgi:hypothetical protein
MAKKSKDFNATMQDMLGGFAVDNAAFEGAFKNAADLNEKLAGAALDAAQKSAELSNKWTSDALTRLSDASKAQADPAEYAKSYGDFASASAEMAAENMAAFAEIAKKLQQDTVAMLMAAGKSATEDGSAAVKKATEDMTAAAKKATDR